VQNRIAQRVYRNAHQTEDDTDTKYGQIHMMASPRG
jgi:hypothetical protein